MLRSQFAPLSPSPLCVHKSLLYICVFISCKGETTVLREKMLLSLKNLNICIGLKKQNFEVLGNTVMP